MISSVLLQMHYFWFIFIQTKVKYISILLGWSLTFSTHKHNLGHQFFLIYYVYDTNTRLVEPLKCYNRLCMFAKTSPEHGALHSGRKQNTYRTQYSAYKFWNPKLCLWVEKVRLQANNMLIYLTFA